MDIRSLSSIAFHDIYVAFVEAFSNYFVPFHATEKSLHDKQKACRVNYDLSFGMFDNDRLAAFIIFGIDTLDGKLTAYNAGTGVIPAYRGQKLVRTLYDHTLPILKTAGIQQSTLEVITKNEKAIKIYTGLGYTISRHLHCFAGTVTTGADLPSEFEIAVHKHINWNALKGLDSFYFSWEYSEKGIELVADNYECYMLRENNLLQAFVIINPATGYVARYGFIKEEILPLQYLLQSLGTTFPSLKTNNVDSNEKEVLNILTQAGLVNHIDQYEMILQLH